ncbi:MAG: prepilin-type N-terminal cleavage/methylation domain-containing protein [Planctomycetota bacterium]|nr:prepilin-type N-terminal cleavage/methylation domain-containing protein [Planctomycetota bacterium]
MAFRYRAASTHQRKPRCWSATSHRGFTLLELMIAMAIMATALSVAWPLLRRPLMQNVSQEAAQQVVATLGQARATAITLGLPVLVRYQPGGQLYQLRPVGAPASTTESDTRTSRGPTSARTNATAAADWHDYELPMDVNFTTPLGQRVAASLSLVDPLDEPASHGTDQRVPLPADPSAFQQVHWSAPIHFFPDGRAEQATLSLQGPGGVVIDITLRGLTGLATAGVPQQRPAPPTTTSPDSLSTPAVPRHSTP